MRNTNRLIIVARTRLAIAVSAVTLAMAGEPALAQSDAVEESA